MTMQVLQNNDLQLAAGLGALFAGLGIPGPFGANPSSKVDAGAYEITGTQVMLRDAPGGAVVAGAQSGFNGAYGPNNNIVAGTPDQVDFDGQTGTAQGLTWAHVTAKTGALAGKTGYVAIEFMAPVGWAASHGGTGPVPQGGGGGGGGGVQPANLPSDSTSTSDYTPYILGGAAIVGGGLILWALLAKPKHGGGGKHRRRSGHRRHAHA